MRQHPSTALATQRRPLETQPILALSVLLLLCLAPAAHSSEEAAPDLSGSWKRADDFSQNPNARPQSSRGERMGRGGQGGKRGGGARTGGGRGPRSTGPSSDRRGDRQPLRPGAETLLLEHSEPTVEIQYADGSTRTIYTSKKARKHSGVEAMLADVGKWKGNALIVKSRSARAKFKEKFELSSDGTRLWLTTKLSPNGRPSVTFLQTYERGIVVGIEKASASARGAAVEP